MLLLYVDDMIITGNDSVWYSLPETVLSSTFEMKGLANYTSSGLEVLSDPQALISVKRNIAYAVHTVSQFMAAPRSDHYAAVLRVLRYLKGTMFHGLYFSSTSSLVLRGFSDADWDSDMTDCRSTTGYCFFLGDSLISWRSKKQSLTARSSTEAKYPGSCGHFSRTYLAPLAHKVVEQVNSWAEKHTNGLIKHILSAGSINSTTNLIFANAVYFKGAWRQQFDSSQTKHYDFHLLNGTKVQTPFMTTMEYYYQHMGIYHGFKVLGLPYLKGKDESRRFTMYLYLPDAIDGLPSLIKEMGSQSDFLDQHLPNQMLKARRFLIPKFKIEFAFVVSEMLMELGVVLPFLAGGEGLSEMAEGRKVYVSSIHQKCVVEMNEQGTEAAAVTECYILTSYSDEVDL
ncbi:hypothetical protein OSB04_003336 [Centaurea solstitialis]|uniref:Serpin domain-containing protein n=1 Tax=Centaurea solstitialis TaxID=347529 RepID=A0AA38U6C2_9ASTR|nr:hypothetical protein OSB04_003336 [Centaurea solstitialis]